MNNNKILESEQVAWVLTLLVLGKADRVFPRCRRMMERQYKLTNGVFQRV